MLKKEHIRWKEPELGDFVMFERYDIKRNRMQTDVGIIGRDYYGEQQWLIHGIPRRKESIIFVLTQEGYLAQQKLHPSNYSSLQTKLL